jgi:hypothetical protein
MSKTHSVSGLTSGCRPVNAAGRDREPIIGSRDRRIQPEDIFLA